MYTITFTSGTKIFDLTRHKVREYILTSTQDIEAVYEQASPVTKRFRKELAEALAAGTIRHASPAARRFISVQG